MIKITCDHPTLALKNQVQIRTDNFLKQHGFNYFQYLRCYRDGSCSLLTNETGFFELVSTIPNLPLIYSSYTSEHEKLHSYWFFWDEELPRFPVQLVKEKLNLNHGLTLLRRSKDYYDMIAFALPEQRCNVASFYVTKYKAIEQFIYSFDKHNQDIIQEVSENPIVLAPPYRDTNYEKLCLSKGRFEVNGPNGLFHITSQELACLRLINQGATYKQVGQILKVSPRTVETYLMRIKQRASVENRADLDNLISICT